MQKLARKPSSDPAQEKLRQDKANWNKDVSAFINDVIHLKKMMNGWPSKFYKQRSRITDPVPADPATILGSLAGDFQELAQRGNALVQEQLNYSKTRRQRQPKEPSLPQGQISATPAPATTPVGGTPSPEPPKVDLSKQLAAWEKKYDLVSEASTPISRFLTRMVTPTYGLGEEARKRRLRMDLLKAAITTYRDLGRLQVAIVSSHKDSATVAYKTMQKAWNDWTLVSRGFNMYKNTMNVPVSAPALVGTKPPAGGTVAPPMPSDIEDLPENKQEKPEELEKLEMPPEPGKKAPTAQQQLEATAQAFLKKWLGKARHQLIPKSTSGYRLEIYRLATSARQHIDQIMDLLEKGMDVETMGPIVLDVNREMTTLRLLVRSVHFSEKPGEAQPMGMF